MQLYMRVDTTLRYVTFGMWHPQSTRTAALVTTLYVSPKSIKCIISITNSQIALKFYTRVKLQKVHTNNGQWLDKHPNCIRDNTFYVPQFFEYGTYGQIKAIKGKYDKIRVIIATLGQK